MRSTLVSPLPNKQNSSQSTKGEIKLKKKKEKKTLPWWFIFIAYGISFILVGVSAIFIIARGIEFGDLKTRQWLTSSITGFFSSIFLTQPIKVKEKKLKDFILYFSCRLYVWLYFSH
jgi:hypothetical protein